MNFLHFPTLEATSENEQNLEVDLIELLKQQVQQVSSLSPKESEIIQLVVDGYSNVQIARLLHISTGTVKTHTRSIFTKFNVTDRTAAAVYALRHGFVE